MATKYLHTMIRVTDPDATVAFFNLIGLEEVPEEKVSRYGIVASSKDKLLPEFASTTPDR